MSDADSSEPINISMLGSFPPLRALSSYCFEFASAMSKRVNVEFISFKKIYPSLVYPGGGLKDDYTFPREVPPNLKVKRKLTWYNPISWVSEGISSNGRLLHAQWWSLPLSFVYFTVCVFFRLRGIPVIFTVHNVIPHERSSFYLIASKVLFLLGNHFIVHSELNKKTLMNEYHISSDRITQIPHGPLDFHVCKGMDKYEERKQLGFDKKDRVVLLFGSVRPYKGIKTMLRAFPEVLKTIPEARILIAGKLWVDWGSYEKLIDQLGIEDQIILKLDYIPSADVCRYFTAADLAVLPYEYFDSQSGVGATAISFRTPLIVTDVGGLPDLVSDSRFIIPPENPGLLAKAIKSCLNNDEKLKQMSESSEMIAQRISWKKIANRTIKIYGKVLKERYFLK